MSGTGQNINLTESRTPLMNISLPNRGINSGDGHFASVEKIAMLETMSANSESQSNKLNIRGIEQTRAIAEQQLNESSAQPNQRSTEAFQYSLKLENQTLQAEIAQNIYQKLLNEINQIIYNNSLKRDQKELKINQMVLNLTSGITNLSVIDSEVLIPVMFDGLPSSLISEFLTHSKSSEFIQKIGIELKTKLEYIILYLKRF